MHRCYVQPDGWSDTGLIPDAEEVHHLRRVLRLAPGAEVTAFDGAGRDVRARLEAERKGAARLVPLSAPVRRPRPRPDLVLLQAVAKPHRMDWLVEKAAELGVAELWPLATARVVGRWTARQAAEKVERWRRIAVSALKQCGGVWLPEIRPAMAFDDGIQASGAAPGRGGPAQARGADACAGAGNARPGAGLDLLLVGALTADARPLREVLDAARPRAPARVGLLVGPEGDFTPEEMQQAVAAGAIPVSFGSQVLRVETAALFGLSILRYALA